MKMPQTIGHGMLAPCGMNCMVCYKHVGTHQYAKPCDGCRKEDGDKPESCRKCKIKDCAGAAGHAHCSACEAFPCKLIGNLDRSYRERYGVSLIENGKSAKKKGIADFLAEDRARWTCGKCGGAFSLHDGVCSDCGNAQR